MHLGHDYAGILRCLFIHCNTHKDVQSRFGKDEMEAVETIVDKWHSAVNSDDKVKDLDVDFNVDILCILN